MENNPSEMVVFSDGSPGFDHGQGNPPWLKDPGTPGFGHGQGEPPWLCDPPAVPEPVPSLFFALGILLLLVFLNRRDFRHNPR